MQRIALSIALLGLIAIGALAWWRFGAGAPDAAAVAPVERDAARPSAPEASLAAAPAAAPANDEAPSRAAVSEKRPAPAPVSAGRRSETPRGTGVVHGRVVDSLGAPVSGALVRGGDGRFALLRPGQSVEAAPETRTNAAGKFELSGLDAGDLELNVRASGFAPLDRPDLRLAAGAALDAGDLVLAGGAILSGRVVDPAGRGVAGAKLFSAGDGIESWFPGDWGGDPLTTSDETGAFRIDVLACGPWRLRVTSEDHPDRVFEGTAERPLVEQSGLVLALEEGASIAGAALGVPDGEREAVRVVARPEVQDGGLRRAREFSAMREAQLGEGGLFEFRGLRPGTSYTVQLVGGVRDGMPVFVRGRRSPSVKAEAGARGIELVWQPEAAVTFQVVDAKTGAPIESLRASAGTRWLEPVRGEDGRVLTRHPEGRVRAGNLFAPDARAQASIEVRAAGYQDYLREDLALAPGAEIDLGVIRLEPAPVLVVSVRDARTGEAVANASVRLEKQDDEQRMGFGPGRRERRVAVSIGGDEEGEDVLPFGSESRRARTDEGGVAVLSSFPGEACRLQVQADGFAPSTVVDLVLPSGERVEREVSLSTGGSVLVRARDADGQALAGARVLHRPPGAATGVMTFGGGRGLGQRDVVTEADGSARFARLEPGTHAFRLDEEGSGRGARGGFVMVSDSGGDGADWREIEVAEGADVELVVEASPRGVLAGRVTESGRPLAGATVRVDPAGDGSGMRMPRMRFGGGDGGDEARTDGDGRYRIEGLKVGDYDVSVTHPARAMPSEHDLEVERGDNDLDVALDVAIVEGKVRDPQGKPLAGVRLRAERKRGEGEREMRAMFVMAMDDGNGEVVTMGDGSEAARGTTDAEGRYQLRGVTPGVDLVVVAESEDTQPARSDAVHLAADQIKSGVDFVLEPAATLAIEAVRADGTPAGMYMVVARPLSASGEAAGDTDGSVERGFVGPNGKTRLPSLAPGKWRVELQSLGQGGPTAAGAPQDIELVAGATATARFDV